MSEETNPYRVFIIESERGWGSRVDEIKKFATEQEALEFTDEYNAKWNPPVPTPDWYMVAVYVGKQ